MTDETEQKILDAALKVFSEKGYDGAKTKVIAKESGFSEVTLFNKFKSKKNLYNTVASKNIVKIKEDFGSLIREYKFENPKDFLTVFINDLAKVFDDNFEFIHLTVEEANKAFEPVEEEFIILLSEYIKKNIKNDKIDCNTLAFTLFTFTYMSSLGKYKGRSYIDLNKAKEGFINNILICNQ